MRTTKTILLGSSMVEKFILCQLLETETNEIILNKIGEYWQTEEAKDAAGQFITEDRSIRIVLLTEIRIGESKW
jgi:hypothetical protein